MKISVIAFSLTGLSLAEKLEDGLSGHNEVDVYVKSIHADNSIKESLNQWAEARFQDSDALIFVCSCGIAVRAIAPLVRSKKTDPAVIAVDELGLNAIALLSGHLGGANELARYLAAVMEAEAVITTATDLHEKFAVDLFAKKNHLQILNKDGIAKVSAKVLAGETITISIESGHYRESGDTDDSNTKEETNLDQSKTLVDKGQAIRMIDYPPTEKVDVVGAEEPERYDASIYLRPKQYVVGMGCRKDKDSAELMTFYRKTLEQENIEPELVYALASIDKKKEEAGLLAICERKRIPFLVYTAEELSQMNGMFHASSFVETQVGVDNVCERAALAGCGKGGKLIYEKHAQDGMTIAIAKRDWSVGFDEE